MLLQVTENGLYCEAGDFFIDPWKPVDRALITHAHSDHARQGSRSYLCANEGVGVLRVRLGETVGIRGVEYGERIDMNGVSVSFHPAGHVLGSAQIRVEHQGEVWVVSGDYKVGVDRTCTSFEPIRCHTFVTESTFGLPVYRWPPPDDVFSTVNGWWRTNQEEKTTSILFGYSLGKAQRLLAGVDASIGPILVHPAIEEFLPAYTAAGVSFPKVAEATPENVGAAKGQALVIAPPAAEGSGQFTKFGEISTAFASGWMLIRGARRRRSADRGFALSDHADWPGLIDSIRATQAERVLVTHGYCEPMVRWLNENGWRAEALQTRFVGEAPEETAAAPSEVASS